VWEYQKRGALHAHFLISSKFIEGTKTESFRQTIYKAWYRILGDIGKKFGANMFLGSDGGTRDLKVLLKIYNGKRFANCQIVRKSVVAYLSSYLSNSSDDKKAKGKQALRKNYFPIATWAQWDRNARKLCEKYTYEVEIGTAKMGNTFHVQKAIKELEKDLPIVEGTEVKYPKNPFIKGIYFLCNLPSEKHVKKLVDLIGWEMKYTVDDEYRYLEWLRENRYFRTEEKPDVDDFLSLEDELTLREASWKIRKQREKEALECGEFVAYFGMFMLEFFQQMVVLQDDFLSPIYEQLSINYDL
jgi:hypothetical protein